MLVFNMIDELRNSVLVIKFSIIWFMEGFKCWWLRCILNWFVWICFIMLERCEGRILMICLSCRMICWILWVCFLGDNCFSIIEWWNGVINFIKLNLGCSIFVVFLSVIRILINMVVLFGKVILCCWMIVIILLSVVVILRWFKDWVVYWLI